MTPAPHRSSKPSRKPSRKSRRAVIHTDPGILGGIPVFVGTRVPFKNLIDYVAAGDPLERFLDQFPTVRREQAVASLKLAQKLVEAHTGAPAWVMRAPR